MVPKITLVIRTLPERHQMLNETLGSLFPNVNHFDEIVLSFNGHALAGDTASIVHKLCDIVPVFVIYTNRRLDGPSHSNFVAGFLSRRLKRHDLVFILADDDTLCSGSSVGDYVAMMKNVSFLAVGIDNPLLSEKGESDASSQGLSWVSAGETLTPFEFLKLNYFYGPRFTNISGMILPFFVYKEVSFFLSFFGSKGRRSEYCYLTHKCVDFILSPSSPVVCVRQHPGQYGTILPPPSFWKDELIYFLWIWKQTGFLNLINPSKNKFQFTTINFFRLLRQFFRLKLVNMRNMLWGRISI